jgi:hypothetical protein
MSKRLSILLWVLFLVASAGCAGEGGTDLEFNVELAGEVHWETTDQCAGVTTITDATGTATFMDDVSAAMRHCPEASDSANHEDGSIVLTAADGDELYGVYDYPAIDGGEPITITGGTGRFENASGSLDISYRVRPPLDDGVRDSSDFSVPWEWDATMSGTISY